MNNQYQEKLRLFWVIFFAMIAGFFTGYFWQMLVLFLLAYIIWMLDRFFEIETWLSSGVSFDHTPFGGGLWDRYISHAIRQKKELIEQKKRNQKLMVRFNEILRSFPYPTVVINAHNEIQWINKRAAKMLNLQRKKDIGIPINNIIRHQDLSEKLNDDGASEFQLLSPSNNKVVLMVAISRLNRNIRILSVRDISERYYLENLRKNFIANASHEMRTPLTIITGYLEMLSQNDSLDEHAKNMISTAYEHSGRMNDLIKDLLLLSGLEQNNNLETEKEQVSVDDITSEVLNDLQNVKEVSQTFETKLNTDLSVIGVRYQIYSIVYNLVENAVKYSKSSGIIKIVWELENDKACLKIIDQGTGLDQTQISRITQPFYRASHVQSEGIQGTGLGMSIVKQSAQRNNGQLVITSEINHGSEFKIMFDDYHLQTQVTA